MPAGTRRAGIVVATIFCARCGHENIDHDRVCANCGAVLSRPGEPIVGGRAAESTSAFAVAESELVTAETTEPANLDQFAEALTDGSAMLVVEHGPNAGSRFLLDKDTTSVGRHPESDVFLDDVTVSRRHAEFTRGDSDEGATFTVRDVGSLNGTYLHRERVDEAQLGHGDHVQIGKFRLAFIASRR
jgi:hypothetical protein